MKPRTLTLGTVLALLAGCGGGASTSGGCTDPLMIDDLEDGDRFICASGGLHGSWSVAGDGSSTNLSPKGDFTPTLIPGGRGGSKYAARMTGFGFSSGATMGVTLNGEGESRAAYDARALQGVRFWMKSSIPLYVYFATAETTSVAEPGGTCVDTAQTLNCGNIFAFPITAPSASTWTEYEVPFSAGLQPFGTFDSSEHWLSGSAVFEPAHLLEVGIIAPGQSFDVWIDDLRGYTCDGDGCVPTCSDPELPVACPSAPDLAANCWPVSTVCAALRPIHLHDLWGSGPRDIWAVGWFVDRNINPSGGAIVHWDGSSWTLVANDAPDQLRGVWGSGTDDVWAVGGNGTGVIAHWDGSRWSQVPGIPPGTLTKIWGSDSGDVWVVGLDGLVLHFDGTAWSARSFPSSDTLMGVWGSGPTDVWVVGYTGDPNGGAGGIIFHWDGASWSSASVDGQARELFAVRGTGPTDVWAVGALGTAMHWNGASWATTSSRTSQGLWSVWGSGPGDVWAVGEMGAIMHWNGVTWSAGEPRQSMFGVWGTGAADAWTVGNWGEILRWDGAAWSPVANEGLRP